MKYFLIMNPASKGGSSKKRFELIHSQFKGLDYDFEYTRNLEHSYELSQLANFARYDVVVAVGGDGTINNVINGFYDENGKRISGAIMAVIYTGTSPDFCKTYNIPLDQQRAAQVILNGITKKIDVGKIEFVDGVKYFACCANIGLGATLANNANSGIRKIFGDTIGTFLALIKTLFQYKPIDICVNGKDLQHVYNLSVGKTFYVASGLKIKHELRENDDRFYLLSVQNKVVSVIKKLYAGSDVELEYADEVKITGNGKVEFDGDEGGQLPCTITNAERLDVIYDGIRND